MDAEKPQCPCGQEEIVGHNKGISECIGACPGEQRRIAVLHHTDADGFGAAFAAWYGKVVMIHPALIRPDMKLFPVQYAKPNVPSAELLADLATYAPHEVYILDFSYDRGALLDLQAVYPHLVVIDHHKTAEADLKDLSFCLFDQTRSGCALAWNFFCGHEELALPAILGYVEDRDLWKFELPNSRTVNAYIATLPEDFMAWLDFTMETALLVGGALVDFQDRQIASRVKGAVLTSIFPPFKRDTDDYEYVPPKEGVDYFNVPIVNATENISELGDALAAAYPDAPFTMSYCDRPGGKRSYSLRSRNGFDVSVVAKAFGGGGHAGAAGFTLDAPSII